MNWQASFNDRNRGDNEHSSRNEKRQLGRLTARFQKAVRIIQNLPKEGSAEAAGFCISNTEKLHLYALYKQAMIGDVTGSRPSIWDPVGRAKWDAWAARRSITKSDAMQAYVNTFISLLKRSPNRSQAAELVEDLTESVDASSENETDSSSFQTSTKLDQSAVNEESSDCEFVTPMPAPKSRNSTIMRQRADIAATLASPFMSARTKWSDSPRATNEDYPPADEAPDAHGLGLDNLSSLAGAERVTPLPTVRPTRQLDVQQQEQFPATWPESDDVSQAEQEEGVENEWPRTPATCSIQSVQVDVDFKDRSQRPSTQWNIKSLPWYKFAIGVLKWDAQALVRHAIATAVIVLLIRRLRGRQEPLALAVREGVRQLLLY